MKVNVLGTVYRIKYVTSLDGRGGETDFYTKEIRISEQNDIPAEYKIVKNGAIIDRSGLKKYDVVTLDAAKKQALVSDMHFYSNPAWIRAALHMRHGL